MPARSADGSQARRAIITWKDGDVSTVSASWMDAIFVRESQKPSDQNFQRMVWIHEQLKPKRLSEFTKVKRIVMLETCLKIMRGDSSAVGVEIVNHDPR